MATDSKAAIPDGRHYPLSGRPANRLGFLPDIYYRSNFGSFGHLQRIVQLNAKIKHIFRGKNSNLGNLPQRVQRKSSDGNQRFQLDQRSLATALGHAELSGNNVSSCSV